MCLLFGEEPRNNTTASNVSASLFRPQDKSTTAVHIKTISQQPKSSADFVHRFSLNTLSTNKVFSNKNVRRNCRIFLIFPLTFLLFLFSKKKQMRMTHFASFRLIQNKLIL